MEEGVENLSVIKDSDNMNVRAAAIHIIGDLIQSIGVIIASTLIYFKPEYKVADPICTFIFSVIVMFTTIPVVKDCIKIIMEAIPEKLDIEAFTREIKLVEGVDNMHCLHVWVLS